MNKKFYQNELIELQSKIFGLWKIFHTNNELIDFYKKNNQEYNAKQYKQKNFGIIQEIKILTREYKKTQYILKQPERKIKPTENLVYLNQFGLFKGIKREDITEEMIEKEEELGQERFERMAEL